MRGKKPARSPIPEQPLRLQAFMARGGVASRRASEKLIEAGRVRVNGRVVTEMGSRVVPGRDRIQVDGREIHLSPPVWIAFHKPSGYVTTRKDPQGRRTIYDLLPREHRELFHVGRLDRASYGLLLLTNEGKLANRLLHPRYGLTREYLARVAGTPNEDTLERLVRGVKLEDGVAQAIEVQGLGRVDEDVSRVRIVLQEGRNREVRRMMEAVGHPVRRLVRKRFGPIRLGNLARGAWRRLSADEIESLRAATTSPPAS